MDPGEEPEVPVQPLDAGGGGKDGAEGFLYRLLAGHDPHAGGVVAAGRTGGVAAASAGGGGRAGAGQRHGRGTVACPS